MTKDQAKQSEAVFKDFARQNRWRLTFQADRMPIAPTRSKKHPQDHIFEGFLDGSFGVYIYREKTISLNIAIRELVKRGATLARSGSNEAIFNIRPEAATPVALYLKIVKRKGGKGGFSKKLEN